MFYGIGPTLRFAADAVASAGQLRRPAKKNPEPEEPPVLTF